MNAGAKSSAYKAQEGTKSVDVALSSPGGSGDELARERYEALMGPGGIANCAKSMNCVEVCPKDIPLMESIASMNRQITRHLLVDWLKD